VILAVWYYRNGGLNNGRNIRIRQGRNGGCSVIALLLLLLLFLLLWVPGGRIIRRTLLANDARDEAFLGCLRFG
jgi:hypothetical protein